MNIEKLGRLAVTCPRWRWMPGMLMIVGMTTMRIQREGDEKVDRCGIPDLSDPATLGCLLHLVREATGQQSSASWYPGGKHEDPHWAWYSDDCYGKLCEGATEAECLVRVLEYIR